MIALQTHDLGLKYGDRWILEKVNLEIVAGDFVCLLGSSGCGKSTLLKLLSNIMLPTNGSIDKTPGALSFVFQEPRLLPWRNVRENVLLPFELNNQPPVDPEEILRAVGLWDAQSLFPHELSGGMKQRCAIARALITNPQLLLMDEPFSALDEHTRENLETLLRKLWQSRKMTLIFVTHSISESVYLGERLILMSRNHGQFVVDRRTNLGERTPELRSSPEFIKIASELSAQLRGTMI